VTSTEGLRERKKRLMRQQLSDTAARLFLERGFAAVPVAAVAEACGVSVKTVFNYFPTKEALLLDRLEETARTLRTELARPDRTSLEAVLGLLAVELAGQVSSFTSGADPSAAMSDYRRFGDLIRETPSLRAYRNDMADRFVTMAAEALAERAGTDPEDPEPQITAAALVGLWRVQAGSIRRHLRAELPPNRLRDAVTADVQQAAAVLSRGLPA